jgi:hypothetical protein
MKNQLELADVYAFEAYEAIKSGLYQKANSLLRLSQLMIRLAVINSKQVIEVRKNIDVDTYCTAHSNIMECSWRRNNPMACGECLNNSKNLKK